MQDPSGELTITGVVQREAWLRRAMPPAEQLGQDLWSLPVPIPDNPLRYVSVQRGAPPDPLGDYLDSLARTRDLDVDEVLPAHEWRFRRLPARVDAITAHHERRLAELLDAIRRRPGSTPWQLAGELTWSRPWNQYSGQMRIFAVTETAAHTHLLERRGLVTASRTRPPAYTARAAGSGGREPGQLLAARPAGSSTGSSARSTLLRSGSRAAAARVITTHAMM
jgi:hypothetical protein